MEDRPVRPASSATRTTGARRRFADEVVIQIFKSAGHDGPGAQGRRARLRPRPERRPVQRAQDRAEHPDRRRQRPTAGRSSRSTTTAPAPARRSRAAARRPRRSSIRRSATRSATPSTSRRSSTGSSAATATSGTTIVPPVLGQWHVEPDHPRTFDIELGQAEARRRRLQARRERQAARQGRQADHPPAVHARFGRRTTRRPPQFIKDWYGQLGIKVQTQVLDAATLGDDAPAARGRRRRQRPSTTSSCGAGAATRTRTRCSRSSDCDEIGNTSDSQYCNPAYDKLYDEQPKAARPTSARRSWRRCRT